MKMTEFIEAEKNAHTVATMCRALEVPERLVYETRHRNPSIRKQADERLGKLIRVEFINHRKTYGCPRLTRCLQEQGERISPKRVARLMRENGLDARPKRTYVRTTNSDHTRGDSPNLLQRKFHVDAPNRVWVGDITYVPTDEGWLYLGHDD